MTVEIRLAHPDELVAYTKMLQPIYVATYVDESIGLTKDCFSEEVFASDQVQNYLRDKLTPRDGQRTWFATDDGAIVGTISITDNGDDCEMAAFYVRLDYQGRGIGKRLWHKALDFAGEKPITLDLYSHNHNAIELYTKWGFVEDVSRPRFYRRQAEWPEGLEAECLYMRREPNKNIG